MVRYIPSARLDRIIANIANTDDLKTVSSVQGLSEKYSVSASSRLFIHDSVLLTDRETAKVRDKEARKAARKQSWATQIIDGLPVPDVDRKEK
jgi:hypothetical protein